MSSENILLNAFSMFVGLVDMMQFSYHLAKSATVLLTKELFLV